MIVLKKAAALLVALGSGLGLELHPKVAASGAGAVAAGALLASLAASGVHIASADQDVLAVTFTILAAFLHPADA